MTAQIAGCKVLNQHGHPHKQVWESLARQFFGLPALAKHHEQRQHGLPVLLSSSCTWPSADVMLRPNGKGNSRSPHFLPLLKEAVSSSSPRMSRGKGSPLLSSVNGFISSSVKSRSKKTCQALDSSVA